MKLMYDEFTNTLYVSKRILSIKEINTLMTSLKFIGNDATTLVFNGAIINSEDHDEKNTSEAQAAYEDWLEHNRSNLDHTGIDPEEFANQLFGALLYGSADDDIETPKHKKKQGTRYVKVKCNEPQDYENL